MPIVLVASNNPGKLKEYAHLFAGVPGARDQSRESFAALKQLVTPWFGSAILLRQGPPYSLEGVHWPPWHWKDPLRRQCDYGLTQ